MTPISNSNPFRSEVLIELHVPDFDKAIQFYGLLGFRIQWREDRYVVLKKNNQVLCFFGGDEAVSEHSFFGKFPKSTPRGYGVEIVLFADAIEEFYLQVSKSIKIVSPLSLRPWGRKDFRIEDPFGYYLRISEPFDSVMLNITDKKWLLRAIEVSNNCSAPLIYAVGCVVVNAQGNEVATGYTGEISYDDDENASRPHAEEIALKKLSSAILGSDLTLYSTMEPCSERKSGRESCTSRIVTSGIKRIVFGTKEPFDPRLNIECRGAEMLRDLGIAATEAAELQEACLKAVKRVDI